MRFLHTSDLHIGKVVNGFSMLEEQKHALAQITEYAVKRRVDAVFLCGDLYDRSVPPAVAVTVADGFLTGLVDAGIAVFAIAGNHDCGERIGFGSQILRARGLYIEGVLKDPVRYVDMEDSWGTVRVHLLPFARPAQTGAFYGVRTEDYEESVRAALDHVEYLEGGRNLLLAHHFVVDCGWEPETSDSESRVCVGGADQVEAENFSRFQYVALGHLHGPQQVGDGPVYYSGSPVKYSFSETYHEKSVIIGEMGADGSVAAERLPITPIHDMRKIRGKLSDLISPQVAGLSDPGDYILAVLTNEEELIDPIGVLRSVYPRVMQLNWERKGAGKGEVRQDALDIREKSPMELFESFFTAVTGKALEEDAKAVVAKAVDEAKEELS